MTTVTREDKEKALRKKCEKAVLDKGKGLCDQDTVDAAYTAGTRHIHHHYMEEFEKVHTLHG